MPALSPDAIYSDGLCDRQDCQHPKEHYARIEEHLVFPLDPGATAFAVSAQVAG
jgi:hypothetical protein